MKTYKTYTTLQDFKAWSGAIETKETILKHNKATEFNHLIEDLHPDGLSETRLNDILWFEEDFIYNALGIKID